METDNTVENSWTDSSATEWVNGRKWANGIELKVHASVNNLEFAKQYHANRALWDKSFLFMNKENLTALEPGKYTIEGEDAYAMITEAPSKTFDQSGWEAHRQYIDIQYVISGEEKMGVAPLAEATVTRPYDEAKDYANFDAAGQYFIATPAEFFLFFPEDVHRPNILIEGFDMVKKVVIKIRVAA